MVKIAWFMVLFLISALLLLLWLFVKCVGRDIKAYYEIREEINSERARQEECANCTDASDCENCPFFPGKYNNKIK